MNPFYLLYQPVAPPAPPVHWSYSGLVEWRTCPRRWWLLWAKYPHITGTYPTRFGAEALEGKVVHQLLEDFAAHASGFDQHVASFVDALVSFGPRVRAREILARMVTQVTLTNPRIDPEHLKVRVSLDRCLNQFKRAVSVRPPRLRGGRLSLPPATSDRRALLNGHEREIVVDDPPLLGRLDLVIDAEITDFKTGQSSPAHEEQLLFYALLYYMATGAPPRGLVISYPGEQGEVTVPVPEVEALQAHRRLLGEETSEIRRQITTSSSLPEAKVGVDTCRYCPVRQHCNEFWTNLATDRLRALHLRDVDKEEIGPSQVADIALESLPSDWTGSGTCIGWARSPDLGQVEITISREKCPSPATLRPIGARILGGRLSFVDGHWYVTAGSGTEVFWVPPGNA